MIVVDTTVLVYAVGGSHPLAAPCRGLVEMVGDGRLPARTSVEVIQEFTHVRARRRGRDDAVALARRYATLLAPLLAPGADDLDRGLSLFAEHGELGAFDAVLAAVAGRTGAAALVSADHAFGVLGDVRVLDPAGPDFRDRLEELTR